MEHEQKRRGVLILVSGPSGVGKTTLIAQMLKKYAPQLQPVVTATDREKRSGEEEGKHYYFLSTQEFKNKAVRGEFLETIERHGGHYGTLKNEIFKKLREKIQENKSLIMHIDWRGHRKIRELAEREPWLKRALLSIFLQPENIEALKERIEKRGQNTPQEIELRLREAAEDLAHAGEYDYVIVSGSAKDDLAQMEVIYQSRD